MAQSKTQSKAPKTQSNDKGKDLRTQVDQIIERAEKELLHASRQLAHGIDKGTNRVLPPVADDLEQIVDDVFDFAERVMKGQRRMVREMVKAFNDEIDRAQVAGRKATKRAASHVQARRRTATRHRTSTARTGSGAKTPASRAGTTRAPAKKTATRKAATKKA
jgi:hypothetical protein